MTIRPVSDYIIQVDVSRHSVAAADTCQWESSLPRAFALSMVLLFPSQHPELYPDSQGVVQMH